MSDDPHPYRNQSPEATQQLRGLLDAVPTLRRRMDEQTLSVGSGGSDAASDEAAWTYSETHDLAAAFIVAALDHLASWRVLVEGGYQPVYTHMVLVRVAMECALSAYWLTEPGIGSDERRARTYAAQFDSLDEKRKFEDASRIVIKPPGQHAAERLRALMATAQNVGLTKLDRNGKVILALRMPSGVDLFDMYETGAGEAQPSWLYRFLSGYSHGRQWVLMLNAQPVGEMGPGRWLGMVTAQDGATVDVTAHAVRAARRAVDAYVQFRSRESD